MTLEELSQFAMDIGPDIYGFCYYLTGSKHSAEELYQDTFLKITEKHTNISVGSSAKSYCISIAIGLWKNKNRKLAIRQRIAPTKTIVDNSLSEDIDYTPTDVVINKEERALILSGVHSLDAKYKLPIIMYYYWDYPINTIASILKKPNGTIKSRLHKGRQLLKKYLEVHHYE